MRTIFLFSFFLLHIICNAQEVPEGWTIATKNRQPYFAPSLANGMIGITPASVPLQLNYLVQNGVYDCYGRGEGVTNIVMGINSGEIEILIGNFALSQVPDTMIHNWEQVLDMKNATLITRFDFGNLYRVEYHQLALRHLPFTFITQVKLTALRSLENLQISNTFSSSESAELTEVVFDKIKHISLYSAKARAPLGKVNLAASNAFFTDQGIEATEIKQGDSSFSKFGFTTNLTKGEEIRFSLLSSVTSSVGQPDPFNEAKRLTLFAYLAGQEKLIQLHQQEWHQLWQSDIIIEGDVNAQRDVRFALYNLYSSIRSESGLSIPPMGLSSNGYNGHIFWDAELWMFPPLLLLQPGMAKSMLDYRIHRLEMARQNAQSHGYKGAMFPWESAFEGTEETPVWALTGPFEHHVTADVGIAFWNYFLVTSDTVWLKEKGFLVLKEVADFWISRAEVNEMGEYEIRNVVCADEYAENVDNNAFTNGAAKIVLEAAYKAAEILNYPSNSQWVEIANKLVIPTFADGTTREHATYKGELIKQADANLLSYPLGLVSDPVIMKKDLDYYSERVDMGPAMTHSIFSVIANRLGQCDQAYRYFLLGYTENQRPPFGVLAECQSCDNPYFVTGAGGMLQAVMNGFGGLEITDQGIVQKTSCLPKDWKSITITGVGPEKVTFRVLNQKH